jgi:hypothetical protein
MGPQKRSVTELMCYEEDKWFELKERFLTFYSEQLMDASVSSAIAKVQNSRAGMLDSVMTCKKRKEVFGEVDEDFIPKRSNIKR